MSRTTLRKLGEGGKLGENEQPCWYCREDAGGQHVCLTCGEWQRRGCCTRACSGECWDRAAQRGWVPGPVNVSKLPPIAVYDRLRGPELASNAVQAA